ncbi:MAG: acyl-CoA thioesterase [Candidatus Thiodiazotropha sp. (ex. Lucinisca nassula)]|nr:acyl-CoA thioesterase [Candidatus Thiodiazotropha sp. (ex. Lucinisca nassula)]PUB79837.1 MAG: acyl-CoA thioesterase [gamma proteobacterium symbiont of Ctena orbiculata]PUB91566.1 MAG: acyl-CoA thioesterase [gamma proteobacterium symbiont of Ctena orbiculata]
MKKIEYTKTIYTYEIDASQHASNIAYIQWMEVARLRLLEKVGLPIHEIKSKGFVPALVRTNISYKKPLFIGDEVRVVLWLSELRSMSANMSFEFYNQHNQLVATGEQAGLFISLEKQRPHKLSQQDRKRFEPYVSESSK